MGQAEVIKVLEKSQVPMSRNEIAEKADDKPINISKMLRILLRHDEIKCIELDRFQTAKHLGWKTPIRRTRFYYVEIKQKEIKKWE